MTGREQELTEQLNQSRQDYAYWSSVFLCGLDATAEEKMNEAMQRSMQLNNELIQEIFKQS